MILPGPAGKRKGRAAVPWWAREGRIQRNASAVNQDSEIAMHIRQTPWGNRCRGPYAEKLPGVRATERVDPVHDLRRAGGKPPGEFLGQEQMLGRARAAPLTDHASDGAIRGSAVLQGAHRLDDSPSTRTASLSSSTPSWLNTIDPFFSNTATPVRLAQHADRV
jgi:hypothetical protein